MTVVGDLFLSANFGVKMVMVTTSKVVRASDVKSAGSQAGPLTETALLTLGEIAISSDKVEGEVSISMIVMELDVVVYVDELTVQMLFQL